MSRGVRHGLPSERARLNQLAQQQQQGGRQFANGEAVFHKLVRLLSLVPIAQADAQATIRVRWWPALALTLLAWVELTGLAFLGLRPEAALSTIAGPIAALSHDLTLAVALPIPLPVIGLGLVALMGVRIWVYRALTGWSWARWVMQWVMGLVAVLPIATILVAFALTGVPYLWAAAGVFALALTAAMAQVFGQYSCRWAYLAPLAATGIGALARLCAAPMAFGIMALGAPVVAILSVRSFNPAPGPVRPWRVLGTIVGALGVVMVGTGVLYILLRPSPIAPPEIQAQLEHAQASTDPHRVILVDGFNTSRETLPWLGTEHPATWFSYAGLSSEGQPNPYHARDTLSGVFANTDELAAQISAEATKGKVSLVGISQGTWIIMATLREHPALRVHIERIVLIDTPLSKPWIDIDAPNTHTGLELIAALVRLATPVTIDTQGPLARELTSGTLPDLAEPTGIATVWLRSVTDAATTTPPLSSDTTMVTYWGAHALTIGIEPGRQAVGRVLNGELQSQPGSEAVAVAIHALAAGWQLPGEY